LAEIKRQQDEADRLAELQRQKQNDIDQITLTTEEENDIKSQVYSSMHPGAVGNSINMAQVQKALDAALIIKKARAYYPGYVVELALLAYDLEGSYLYAQDAQITPIGKITANNYDANSIFNPYGTYGSIYSTMSIWNQYGTYGSQYNLLSPFNQFTQTPPVIVKDRRIIGYLTKNQFIQGAIDPKYLSLIGVSPR
jgi:hypothetical protein